MISMTPTGIGFVAEGLAADAARCLRLMHHWLLALGSIATFRYVCSLYHGRSLMSPLEWVDKFENIWARSIAEA